MSDAKEKLSGLLYPMLGSKNLVEQWWTTKNKAFDMKTPDQMLKEDMGRVVKYVFNAVGK